MCRLAKRCVNAIWLRLSSLDGDPTVRKLIGRKLPATAAAISTTSRPLQDGSEYDLESGREGLVRLDVEE